MSLSDDQIYNYSMEENQARADWIFTGTDSLNWIQSYANTTTVVMQQWVKQHYINKYLGDKQP